MRGWRKFHFKAIHVQVVREDLLSQSIADSNHVGELTDCSAAVLMDELMNLWEKFSWWALCW